MTSALVMCSASTSAPPLVDDLASLGIHVLGAVQRNALVREATRLAPDVVVAFEPIPEDALFDAMSLLGAASPCAVVVFTLDPDADKIERAVASGVHAYVINGYAAPRLRALLHLAIARFEHERRMRRDLEDIGNRFEERKLVDRAKGVLMRARGMSEDDAFKVLRTASMHANQRVGEIARQVIVAAREAEAVNRSGQLRMLSQRIVKLYAMAALDVDAQRSAARLGESLARGTANLDTLGRVLSKATFGDLLDAVLEPWASFKAMAAAPCDVRHVGDLDALGERLLAQAQQLTSNLQTTGLAPSLEVINASGRQRMLSQRLAKQALLLSLAAPSARERLRRDMAETQAAFESAMAYLQAVPFGTLHTRQALDSARSEWGVLVAAVAHASTPDGRLAVAESSEKLLTLFDDLTDQFERSMQVLLG